MTVASSTDRATFLGNGTTTVFSLPFRFFANSEIQAWLVTNATGALSALTLGTHYTLVGAGLPEVNSNAASVLTMVTAPTSLQSLFVQRVIPATQATDIVNQGRFFPEIHEDVFDRLTMLIQQANGESKGAIRVAVGDPDPARLVPALSRANLLLGFDSAGNPITVAPVSGSAAALATDLANATDPAKGAGQVGYKGRTVYARLADEFHPRDFSGATDQIKLQACIDAAAAAGTGVVLDKNYTIESVRLKAGLKYITGGQLTCSSAVSLEGVIEIDGVFYGGTPCDNVVIDGVTIDGGGVAPRGVFGFTANGVKVINCRIFNLFITDANGIAFGDGSDNCVVVNNRITMPVIAVDASLSFGVYIYGVYNTQRNLDAFNGYATLGAMPRTPNAANHNIVANNIIENGYYSVALDGVLDCLVVGNICLAPHWRGIACTDAWDCTIEANPIRDFGTSGIHLSYGTLNTVVANNTLWRTAANTAGNYEGAIQAYIDCHSNVIVNNNIQSTNRFGIYAGLDVSNNDIRGNTVVGSTLAGIALESEWDASKPAGAIYSRVSTGPNAAQPSFLNTIKGNTIRVVSGAASIAASSLNTVDLRDNDISGNTYSNVSNHDMYFFAENAGNFYRNNLKVNMLIGAVGSAAKYSFSAGRGMFTEVSGNSVLNGTISPTAFADLATTPDVATSDFWSALYTGAATITNFLNGADGQEFTLRGNSNVTIANNANIVIKGGANVTFSGAVPLMRFQKIQGTWLETYRNF